MRRSLLIIAAVLMTLTLPTTSFGQVFCPTIPIQIPFAVNGKIEITDCLQNGDYSDRYSVRLDAGTQITIEASTPSSTTLTWITVGVYLQEGPNLPWKRVLERIAYWPERDALKFDFATPYSTNYMFMISGGSRVGEYSLSIKFLTTTSGPSIAAILPVVGSTPGNGAYFRTGVQIHNPRTDPISGKLVFHTQSVSGGENDPSLSYTLSPGQTIHYSDLLPAMGIASGLGSVDIVTVDDPAPIIAARVFSDAGDQGTAGFFIDPVAPEGALQAGDNAVIIAPSDPSSARLNLGIRSLETGASFLITVRSKDGVVRRTQSKTYGATFFEQVDANSYLGVTLEPSDTITFTLNSGRAIIYGAQTDNKTQDPSVQYAKKMR